MTRTAPVYTVRWSSQISRTNNRLGPPTPAPNAVSAAMSSHATHILHAIISNFRRQSHISNYNNDRHSDFKNNLNYLMIGTNAPKQQQQSLQLFSIETLNLILLVLWIYKFIGIELTICIKSKLMKITQWTSDACVHFSHPLKM